MNETVQAILILMAAYTLFLFSLVTCIHFFKRAILQLKMSNKINAEIARRKQMVADMKARGEFHEWVTIQQKDIKGDIHDPHVCKKTGWCPSLQSFFQMAYVKEAVLREEYKNKYETYRDEQVEMLSTKFKHSRAEMEEIVESVFDIKKQFALLWME